MITGEQIRAARAMLRWKGVELAKASGIGWATIQRMESVDGVPNGTTKSLEAIRKALQKAGIEFINENDGEVGIKFKKKKA